MKMTKKIALTGILTSLAIVVSVLEQFIPLHAILPLPGLKVGIANVIALLALLRLNFRYAAGILLIRCSICAMLFGSPISFAMSLCGGISALCAMWILLRKQNWFSLYGVSIFGAAIHNLGQIVCLSVWMRNISVFSYLPFLLLGSFVTGLIIAVICASVNRIRFK